MKCTDIDLIPNYAALWVAIIHGVPDADTAFLLSDRLMDGRNTSNTYFKRPHLSVKDNQSMYNLRQEGMNLKEIGELFGISNSAVLRRIQQYCSANGIAWKSQNSLKAKGDNDSVLELCKQGLSVRKIAEHTGRSKTSVQRFIKRSKALNEQ